MLINDSFQINEENHLTIGGVDVCHLAEKYGTPLYIMDEELIRNNCRVYKNALENNYDSGKVLYASKAFSCLYMYQLIQEEGLGIDVVSGGELFTALKAGFPANEIYFHGNNKTPEELKMAILNQVGRIVVDNKFELALIDEIAKEYQKNVSVLFRIKPGIEAHTHDFIQTGQIDSKFGFALENGEAEEIIKIASVLNNIEIVGIHCHIGSQIFDLMPFEEAANVMISFMADMKDRHGVEIKELNLGGGYGIKYTQEDQPVEYGKYIESVAKVIDKLCAEKGLAKPKVLMEPGRSIVGEAGITVYTVGSVKEIKDVRTYVSIDGGMTDNPRYALYQSVYTVALANKMKEEATNKVTIAGKCCESGDLIAKDVFLPPAQPGDLLCVFSTGAYNYSMASNYNRIPRLPVVMVQNGEDKLIVKRESYEDLIKNDIL